jgi:hypothetical protein
MGVRPMMMMVMSGLDACVSRLTMTTMMSLSLLVRLCNSLTPVGMHADK